MRHSGETKTAGAVGVDQCLAWQMRFVHYSMIRKSGNRFSE